MVLGLVAAVVLSQDARVHRCEISLQRAAGASASCEGVRLRQRGWVGLEALAEGRFRLIPLKTRPDERDPFAGLCAPQTVWADLALKGPALRPGPREAAELHGDPATCQLPTGTFVLGGVTWRVTPSDDAVRIERPDHTGVTFQTGSSCWTGALLVDLDGDTVPDLITTRDGGGFVMALFLSGIPWSGAAIGACAQISGPPC